MQGARGPVTDAANNTQDRFCAIEDRTMVTREMMCSELAGMRVVIEKNIKQQGDLTNDIRQFYKHMFVIKITLIACAHMTALSLQTVSRSKWLI